MIDLNLEKSFDELLFQLSKGVSIDRHKEGTHWDAFEHVKSWNNRFGYSFQIYPNDHFIEQKPHFHLIKKSDGINCKYFFDGSLISCGGDLKIDKKITEAIIYFLSIPKTNELLVALWNKNNPNLKL